MEQTQLEQEGWKKVEGSTWRPVNVGDSLTGILIVRDPQNNDELILETADKKRHSLPRHTILRDLLSNVNVGEQVMIKFLGTKSTNKGNDAMLYEVWSK